MINYFLILFKKIGILMKNKRINSLFTSEKKKVIREDENKIDYTSSQYYTNDQIIQLKKLFFETLY